jgi:hypothetical protein
MTSHALDFATIFNISSESIFDEGRVSSPSTFLASSIVGYSELDRRAYPGVHTPAARHATTLVSEFSAKFVAIKRGFTPESATK